MKRSQLFIKTRRDAPADETAKNAQLLIRAGYIHKEMAGVYSYLPLGLAVIDRIKQIVREEMNAIGGEEMLLSSLQNPELWQATDRWSDDKVDIWFKAQLSEGSLVGLGWSHEEPMAQLMTQFIQSYKDLPVYAYQFQTKLRKELRAKSGLLRGREFVMKDLYSFSKDAREHDKFYGKAIEAYKKIYERLGIGDITYVTFASGGPFSEFSHEFQAVISTGEDTISIFDDGATKIAINKEILKPKVLKDLGISDPSKGIEKKAVEVGNIFSFGSRYSEPLGLVFTDEDGSQKPVYMGSYGVGISRLMGLLAEHFADERGLIWQRGVAPFEVYLCRIGSEPKVTQATDKLYEQLTKAGVQVLYDDRDERPGEQFADADLMGAPVRLVVSEKSLEQGGVELKKRTSEQIQIVPIDAVSQTLAKALQD